MKKNDILVSVMDHLGAKRTMHVVACIGIGASVGFLVGLTTMDKLYFEEKEN